MNPVVAPTTTLPAVPAAPLPGGVGCPVKGGSSAEGPLFPGVASSAAPPPVAGELLDSARSNESASLRPRPRSVACAGVWRTASESARVRGPVPACAPACGAWVEGPVAACVAGVGVPVCGCRYMTSGGSGGVLRSGPVRKAPETSSRRRKRTSEAVMYPVWFLSSSCKGWREERGNEKGEGVEQGEERESERKAPSISIHTSKAKEASEERV